jgi:hypothetical protein
MGFENSGELNKKNKEDELKDPGRRKFLKDLLIGSAGLAVSVSPLRKAFGEEKKKEIKTIKPKIEKFEFNAEKIAQEILRAYNSSAISCRFNPEVFTQDFFMAQQFQESRGDYQAESSSGARGVYQNKPVSVKDVIEYLAFLRKYTRNLPASQRCDYNGPNSISLKEAEEISKLFLEKADYGRATGKLYLLSIHDKESKYNNSPNPDVFRSKSPERQQELLLLSYHDGPSCRLHPEKASENAKEYVHLVKKCMKTIADIRDRFERAGISRNLNYAILKILQELDRKENRNKSKEVISHWLEKLQQAHRKKWQENGNIKESLNIEEISKIFA